MFIGPINACVEQHSSNTVHSDVSPTLFFSTPPPHSDAELPPDGKGSEYVSVSVKRTNWQANTLQRLHQFTCKRNKWTDKRGPVFFFSLFLFAKIRACSSQFIFWQKIAQSQPKCDVFRRDLRRFFSPWGQPVPGGSLVACHLSEGPKGFVQCSSEGFMKDCCWVSVVHNHKTEWICELRGRCDFFLTHYEVNQMISK